MKSSVTFSGRTGVELMLAGKCKRKLFWLDIGNMAFDLVVMLGFVRLDKFNVCRTIRTFLQRTFNIRTFCGVQVSTKLKVSLREFRLEVGRNRAFASEKDHFPMKWT